MILGSRIGHTLAAQLWCLWFSNALCMAEPVRIAHNTPFPPFAELKDGKSQGLAIDILRTAAGRAGIETEFIAVPIEQVEQTLRDGRADALLQSPNPERLKSLDFSAPVLTTGGALYVRSPNPTPENLLVMSGKVVVTPQAGPLAAIISRSAPAVKLSVTTDYEQSLARLIDGTADAAALNYHVGGALADRLYPGQVTKPRGMFWEAPLAIGVLKGQRGDILDRLNKGLAAIRDDGTWQQINARWVAQ